MAIDIFLTKAILHVLDTIGEPHPEESLTSEVEIRISKPLTTTQFEDSLSQLEHARAISRGKDLFGRRTWKITDFGKKRLNAL
jgi:hypothetical protein